MDQELSARQVNLAELQSSSLRLMSLVPAGLGYTWLALTVWPLPGLATPPVAWIGSLSLLLSAVGSLVLGRRWVMVASRLLVAGCIVAVTAALLTFRQPCLAYLYLLPVIYADILLSQWTALAHAGLVTASTLAIGRHLGYDAYAPEVLMPAAMIVLAAVALQVSARNLYVALDWVWSGYEQAHENERRSRQDQADLRRALKALDEASYRLERANHMLSLARDQAEEARRLKQQFAQTISHELRTPLNLVVSFTDLMVQAPEYYGDPLPPAYARDLGIIHRNACHLQTLINDVLDLARIEAAQMAIFPEETEPGQLVEEAISSARNLVESRGLAMRVEVEQDLPRLYVDPNRIRQVLYNLLNNAARFTERGSVTVSVRRRGEDVIFAVIDTGIGIAADQIPRIFEEFQQVDGGTRRRHEGAGLGLAISRGFVELHGGHIWAESQVGKGSTFSFVLPVGHRSPLLHGTGGQPRAQASPCATFGEEPILLAVTRSPEAAGLLTRYVHGCRTVVVPDLEQAHINAAWLLPQTVVIDTAHEDLDAPTLRALAQSWGLPRTPFLACPLPGEEPLRQFLEVDSYLIKPVSRKSLWDVLRQLGKDVDKILVADDDRDFVRLMGRLLDSPLRPYQVIAAYNGQDALEMINYHKPDVVLLDLMLPDLSGAEVIERIRSSPSLRYLPIVVVSGLDDVDGATALPGVMLATSASGLLPGEVVQWVQSAIDAASRRAPTPHRPTP